MAYSSWSLVYVGVIQLDRNGRAEVRSVGDEALAYLRRRADVSDLAVAPQPYQVLLSFQPMHYVKLKLKLAVLPVHGNLS